MKQFLSVLASLLLSSVVTLAAPPKPNPLEDANLRLERIETRFNKLSNVNDSLTKELLYFKAKEDYYSAAMTRQGDHLEWTIGLWITVIVTAASLFSWGIFRMEINKARKEARRQAANIVSASNELNRDYKRLKHRIYVSVAILFNNNVAYNPPDINDLSALDVALDACMTSIQFSADAYLLEQEGVDKNTLHQVDINDRIITSLDNTNKALDQIDTYLNSIEDPVEKNKKLQFLREGHKASFEILDKLKSKQTEPFDFTVASLKERLKKLLEE